MAAFELSARDVTLRQAQRTLYVIATVAGVVALVRTRSPEGAALAAVGFAGLIATYEGTRGL